MQDRPRRGLDPDQLQGTAKPRLTDADSMLAAGPRHDLVMPNATVLDVLPPPPCARTLGWRLIDARPKEGWVRVGFEAQPAFANPAGAIQGGFLTAMLDDCMGPAVFLHTEGALYTVTIGLSVSFMAPARPGPLYGEGRIVQLGKSIAYLEAELQDAEGRRIASATSSARLIPAEKALAPA